MYEYLTRTWKYFKRTDVLRLNARPPRGTNGEWYLGSSIGSIALLLIFKILYFARQIVPIEINPASWADSCCDNSRPSSTLYLQSIPREAKPRANPHPLLSPPFDPPLLRSPPIPLPPFESNHHRQPYSPQFKLLFHPDLSSILPPFFSPRSLFLFHPLFANIFPFSSHSLSLSLSVSRSLDCSSIAGDRFVKLLIFFLALRPRSCHPDRAPLYPRILAFIPDVVEKYQPRCVTRLLLSLLLLFPPLFHSR